MRWVNPVASRGTQNPGVPGGKIQAPVEATGLLRHPVPAAWVAARERADPHRAGSLAKRFRMYGSSQGAE